MLQLESEQNLALEDDLELWLEDFNPNIYVEYGIGGVLADGISIDEIPSDDYVCGLFKGFMKNHRFKSLKLIYDLYDSHLKSVRR